MSGKLQPLFCNFPRWRPNGPKKWCIASWFFPTFLWKNVWRKKIKFDTELCKAYVPAIIHHCINNGGSVLILESSHRIRFFIPAVSLFSPFLWCLFSLVSSSFKSFRSSAIFSWSYSNERNCLWYVSPVLETQYEPKIISKKYYKIQPSFSYLY